MNSNLICKIIFINKLFHTFKVLFQILVMKKIIYFLLVVLVFTNCSDNNNSGSDVNYNIMYFPPTNGTDTWETQSISSLGWNQNAVQPLLDYLLLKNTKSFMILVYGRIVMENYFNGHTATTLWRWNSAGKTLTSTVTGIAEQEGFINTNNKVSDYLGTGWTSAPLSKENLITCKNL